MTNKSLELETSQVEAAKTVKPFVGNAVLASPDASVETLHGPPTTNKVMVKTKSRPQTEVSGVERRSGKKIPQQ